MSNLVTFWAVRPQKHTTAARPNGERDKGKGKTVAIWDQPERYPGTLPPKERCIGSARSGRSIARRQTLKILRSKGFFLLVQITLMGLVQATHTERKG